MTGQMLALPVGPEGREIAWLRACPRVGGPWETFEREVKEELLAYLQDRVILLEASETVIAPDLAGPLDHFRTWQFAEPGRWARVRVHLSVEVLDGIP